MIALTLDDRALHDTTVTVSPYIQAVAALMLLGRYGDEVPPPHTRWARRTKSQVGVRAWRQLLQVGGQLHAPPIPSALAPAGAVAAEDLDTALAALSPAVDVSHIDHTRFIDTIVMVHDVAVEPWWPEIRRLLDWEAQRCNQILEHGRGEELLHTLEGRLRWVSPVLSIPSALPTVHGELSASRLTVSPTIFNRGVHLLALDAQLEAVLTFPARGSGALPLGTDLPAGGARRDRLAILIGAGRATVLRTLIEPSTTTEISTRISLAPSTVSQHLTSLTEAGVIRKGREGRRVLYQLTSDGFELLRRHDT